MPIAEIVADNEFHLHGVLFRLRYVAISGEEIYCRVNRFSGSDFDCLGETGTLVAILRIHDGGDAGNTTVVWAAGNAIRRLKGYCMAQAFH